MNTKKKALIVASIPGFIVSFEINDIKILKQLGYEVHVACNLTNDVVISNGSDRLKELNVILHNIDIQRNPFSKNTILAYKQIGKLIKKENFSLIHCHTPNAGVITRLAARKQRKYGTKVIYTAHGFHFYEGAPKKNWIIYYPIEKILSKYTDAIITINNEDYKRALNEFYTKNVYKIQGVGVETAKFAECQVDKEAKRKELNIPDSCFVLLSVGEISNRKNQRVVVNAINSIKQTNPEIYANIYYIIVGKGELYNEFERYIEDNSLSEHIKLLGFRSDIAELCKTVDCFVHPSVREGLGIAPIEAMASGLPLISSYVNGIKDYTEDGKSGVCLKNPRDIMKMKDAIIKMYEEPDFRKACGINNLKKSKEYDLIYTDEKMHMIYQKNNLN